MLNINVIIFSTLKPLFSSTDLTLSLLDCWWWPWTWPVLLVCLLVIKFFVGDLERRRARPYFWGDWFLGGSRGDSLGPSGILPPGESLVFVRDLGEARGEAEGENSQGETPLVLLCRGRGNGFALFGAGELGQSSKKKINVFKLIF